MNELLIIETKELEVDIQRKVAEAEGSRAGESASIYFGYSVGLDREVMAGRIKSEEAARLRYTSALCTARKVSDIVRDHKICRTELDRVFAEFRQKARGRHA